MRKPLIILGLAIILAILAAGFSIPIAAGSSFSGDAGDSGAADLAASALNLTADSIEIIFTKSAQTLGNTRTFDIAIGDIDLDGDNDVFMANYIGSSQLWLNDGNAVFSLSPQTFSVSEVHGVSMRDFNSDAYPDIFLISQAGPSKVYFNNMNGTFTAGGQNIGSGADEPIKIVPGDVDSDGDLDVVISYYMLPVKVWSNDGNGFFTVSSSQCSEANAPYMELVDINGDTYVDLFLAIMDQPDEVWTNDGSGNFVNSGQTLGVAEGYDYTASGDIDGDGDIDIALSNSVEGVKIWLNQENTGSFVEAGPYFAAGIQKVALLDADLDEDLELFTSHNTDGNVLWLNTGSANFESLGPIFGNAFMAGIASGKLDDDDDFDVVLGIKENSGGNPVYFNESRHIAAGTCGDANGDESINILDVGYLIGYLYKGSPAPDPPQIADVDHSGAVNILDVGYIVAYLYKGGPAPSCPS